MKLPLFRSVLSTVTVALPMLLLGRRASIGPPAHNHTKLNNPGNSTTLAAGSVFVRLLLDHPSACSLVPSQDGQFFWHLSQSQQLPSDVRCRGKFCLYSGQGHPSLPIIVSTPSVIELRSLLFAAKPEPHLLVTVISLSCGSTIM